ncbi:MAG: hypothetical protein KGL19_16155 [Bacteroidota bacterium]|nr:hypothetical protein [Bacteroidota bacterium]
MRSILLFCSLLLCSTQLLADWPIGKHRTTLIPTYTYFRSTKYYDSTGKVISFYNGDRFVSNTFSVYLAHGLTRRLDFIANVPLTFVSSSFSGKTSTRSGIADCMAGIAYHFPFKDLKSFVTTKALFIFAPYQNTVEPYLGYGSKGFQLAANYSFNPAPNTFLVTEATYTRYLDDATGPEQFGYNITAGTTFSDYDYLTLAISGITSKSTDKSFYSNLTSIKDFNYGKISLAYGRKISRIATPYIQGFYTFYGKNAGIGVGFSAFVIFKLP